MPNLLVVDDEIHIRKLYQEAFSREGFNVATAADSYIAFDILKDQKIDVIILDIELPEISGLEMLKKFKSENPNSAVILNSAYSIYKSDFGSWLADAYVMKSSDMQPLIKTVKELTQKDAEQRI